MAKSSAARKAVTDEKKLPKEMGVKVVNSSIYDYDYSLFGDNKDLKFPYSVQTYKRMTSDTILAAALNAVQVIAVRVPRYIQPFDESDTHKKRAEFVEQCLGISKDINDMTHSFDEFLIQALSMNQYGFSLHEKVYRIRRNKNGSRFDDGKVGIKRLPIRPQESIESFVYDDDGREITHVVQRQTATRTSVLEVMYKGNATKPKFSGDIKIPIENTLLFRASASSGSAEGVSPLSYVYETWKDYQRYKDLEGIAASKNLNGLPVIWMPSEYMTDDASDAFSSVYTTLRDGVSKIAIGEQSSLVLPSDREDMTGQGGKLFDFTLMSASSSNITAITSIIERLKNEMLLCLFSGEMAEGNDGKKTSMLNMLVENRIKEVFTVLNNDLIPDLFRKNGWDDTKTPEIKYGKLREIPFESFAKAMQQTKATKLIAVTPKNINHIAEELGLPDRVDESLTLEELNEILGVEDKDNSKSGAGYETETGIGTAKEMPESDGSASNLYNK